MKGLICFREFKLNGPFIVVVIIIVVVVVVIVVVKLETQLVGISK